MYQLHGELLQRPTFWPKAAEENLDGARKSFLNCLSVQLVYLNTLMWSNGNQEPRYMDGSVWEKYGRESKICF